MKIQTVTFEDAYKVARLLKTVNQSPNCAVIGILGKGPNDVDWWAIESVEDLQEIPGRVESIVRI